MVLGQGFKGFMSSRFPRFLLLLTALCTLLLAVACNDDPAAIQAPPTEAAETSSEQPAPSEVEEQPAPPPQTAIPPTPTPTEPLAATVNGDPIYLSTFEEMLARYQQGQALMMAENPEAQSDEEQRRLVLEMLIERSLIEQAAAANGIAITPEMIEQQMAELRQVAAEAGGEGSFEAWLTANNWTEESFREALAFEMLTERVSATVTADVPQAVKQVHARYLQVDDPALAESLLEQVEDGADFGALAQQHSLDRATGEQGGDLGYFPAGTLLVPEIEEAAFALEPGEVSDVITGTVGDGEPTYYLVQVVDVDPQRPLSPDLRAMLLQERFETWLAERMSQAEIVRYIEDGAG